MAATRALEMNMDRSSSESLLMICKNNFNMCCFVANLARRLKEISSSYMTMKTLSKNMLILKTPEINNTVKWYLYYVSLASVMNRLCARSCSSLEVGGEGGKLV